MLKYLLLAALLFSISFADTGEVIGTIKTSDGYPVELVNVGVRGTNLGSVTNKEGIFRISNIDPGTYYLVVSYVGKETKEVLIEVEPGEVTEIPTINLNESAKELEEIEVRSTRNKFTRVESEYVAKLPLKNIENPQVYNTITADLLEDQVVTNFNDALKNAPGVDKLWESTGRGGDGAGYYSIRGFAVQPTMVNGLPGLTNGALDPANIERIEVIKGPSGALYGSSLISYGGLINIVTKKPYSYFGGSASYVSGSFGLNRVTADINSPLSEDDNTSLRLVTAYHTENSFQDAGFKESFFAAPSFYHKVNDRLSFNINTEFFTGERTNQTMLFLNRYTQLVTKNLDELNYNNELSYTNNDITIKNPAYNLQAEMKYKLSDEWTSQTVLSRSTAKSDGYYTYLWDLADGNGSYARYISKQNSTTLGTDIQQNFIGDFQIGSLRNRVVAGIDYYNQSTINNSTGYVGYDIITVGGKGDQSNMSRPSVDTALAKTSVTKNQSEEEIFSAYVSDVVNITSQLSVMASLRLDHFNNKGTYNSKTDTTTGDFDQTTLSPKFGLVYQIIENKLSLFANYLNGFNNVSPRTQDDGSTKSFEPEQANQWEVGIKTNLLEDKLTASFSYYNINVSNVVREDPSRTNFYVQDGENFSKGFETSISASPIPGLNIIAGYSFNESEITKTDNPDYINRRPEGAGPKHMFNAWLSYTIHSGSFSGLGLGFGGNYYSENMILNRATTGIFTLPSYTILNASLYYDSDSFRITLKLNNLSDEEYYKGWSTVNPQQPRNLSAGINYRF